MRHDPLYTTWIIRCDSEEDARRLQGNIRFNPNLTYNDFVRAFPYGFPIRSIEMHRLGDYFSDIRSFPPLPEQASSFRILFHRRPDAGRFWKDLMVKILEDIRRVSPNVKTALEYRGDSEPASS